MRDVAAFFKVLGDETRLQMLWMLFGEKELCVCDFMEVLGITQSKASRHLRSLFHAGLVLDRREGTWSYYRLRPLEDPFARSVLRAVKRGLEGREDLALLGERLAAWQERKRGCCAPRCS